MEREFKDSGIEWIGRIPKEWKTCKLNYVYRFQTGATPPTNNESFFDGDYKWASIADLKSKTIYDTTKRLSKAGVEKCSMIISPKGSLMYSFKLSVGTVSFCGDDMYTNEAIATFLEGYGFLPFLYYMAPFAIIHNANYNIYGAPILNQELIKGATIIVPRIADYLDKKCGEIDELIALQEQMIAQLTDYKQSVITEAVTKGLNPDAELVPSGIDWIGDVPKEWKIVPLRYIGRTQNGISQSGDYFGEGFPFVSYSDVYKNYSLPSIFNGLAKSSKQDQKLFSVLEGDVFFTRTSETIDEIGFSSVCLQTVEKAVFAGFLIRFRPYKNKIDKNFSKYYFRSNIHRAYFVKEMNLVTRASLSQELLKSLPVLLPPLSEQQSIATNLDTKCSEIDSLIAIKQQKIETLKDYKKSVIYEAVTGKMSIGETP